MLVPRGRLQYPEGSLHCQPLNFFLSKFISQKRASQFRSVIATVYRTHRSAINAMPAKPLQSVNRNARFAIRHDALRQHPKLAALVAYAITDWARVEANLGKAFIIMLGAEARPAAAMYGSLKSPQAKAETFLAVARITLSDELTRIFSAVLTYFNRVAETRNRLAHGLWALSEDIPSAILVVDAKHELARERDMTNLYFKDLNKWPGDTAIPRIHPKHIFVYFEEDLNEVLSQIDECFGYTQNMATLAAVHRQARQFANDPRNLAAAAETHDRICNWLYSQPALRLSRTTSAPP